MKTLIEVINFIWPSLIPKLKSFDFWLDIGIVIVWGFCICAAIIFGIKIVEIILN